MGRRIFSMPVLLFIPLALLVIVSVAAVYRFSLSDEQIVAKFIPAQEANPVVKAVFGLSLPGALVMPVPETNANVVFNRIDVDKALVLGDYDSGQERGQAALLFAPITAVELALGRGFIAVVVVSNQGSGHFYYLASFGVDRQQTRLVALDSYFLGDRIVPEGLSLEGHSLTVNYLQYAPGQALAEDPQEKAEKQLFVSINGTFSDK
ncbi:hypothetical protein [Vibrio sp. WXL103]|uniref:hypothetical protein n=1 Tax=unclassified Vibrio TaxID=2614977 RepID=UPI003EC661BC